MKFLELEGKKQTVKIVKLEDNICSFCGEKKVVYAESNGRAICEDCINQLAEIIK